MGEPGELVQVVADPGEGDDSRVRGGTADPRRVASQYQTDVCRNRDLAISGLLVQPFGFGHSETTGDRFNKRADGCRCQDSRRRTRVAE